MGETRRVLEEAIRAGILTERHGDAETRGRGGKAEELAVVPEEAIELLEAACEDVLGSIRGYDGKPAQATELERIALARRVAKRVAVNALMPPGYAGAMTVKEAAHRLGLSTVRIHGLCREGRLNGVKVKGRVYVLPEEVEAYAREQEVWRALGGRWTQYGREGRRAPERFVAADDGRSTIDVGTASDSETQGHGGAERADAGTRGQGDAGKEHEQDQWIRAAEAAGILQLSEVQVHRMGQKGKLVRRVTREGPGYPKAWYQLGSVLQALEEREAAAYRKGTSPANWQLDLLHPNVRSSVEAPPGDALITRRDAAEILGVAEARVSVLVAQGRLFGWQKHPGKPGCPLLLSARQVQRHSEDPMRLKRRGAAKTGAAPEDLKVGQDWTEWRWERRINEESGWLSGRHRGEYVTTAQAAAILGVRRGTVLWMRRTGRLKGFHAKTSRRPSSRQWWFFLREDVHDLSGRRNRTGRQTT